MDFADTSPMASLPVECLTGNESRGANGRTCHRKRRERRSRDRYGRDRRERGERAPREGADTNADLAPQDNAVAAPAAEVAQDEAPRRSFHFAAPPQKPGTGENTAGAATSTGGSTVGAPVVAQPVNATPPVVPARWQNQSRQPLKLHPQVCPRNPSRCRWKPCRQWPQPLACNG